jgi:hypothetical protein
MSILAFIPSHNDGQNCPLRRLKVNIDKETVWQILCNNFNMKKVYSKMVPRLLTPEQKELWMNICANILQNIDSDPDFLENIITYDESWFFQYDAESKCLFMHWKSPSSPRQKKAWAEQIQI